MNKQKREFYEHCVANIRSALKRYITDNNVKALVLGISGGADSTLTSILARSVCDELEIPLIGASITIHSNKSDEQARARGVGRTFCTHFSEVGFSNEFEVLDEAINRNTVKEVTDEDPTRTSIRRGNVKARMRMIYLYNIANAHNGIVLSTDNYTELLLGFWTLHGDVGDFGMIQNLWKTEVYEMLEYFRDNSIYDPTVIDDVINADATDGLGITNTDLDQLLPGWEGSSRDGYAEVDTHLKSPADYPDSPAVLRMERTHFKRENPYNLSRESIVNVKEEA